MAVVPTVGSGRLAAVCCASAIIVLGLVSCGRSSGSRTTALTKHQILQVVQERARKYTECMRNYGVMFSQGESDISAWVRGGEPIPKDITPAQAELALRRCPSGSRRVVDDKITDPVMVSDSARFAACLRAMGIAVRGPDLSSSGPALTINDARPAQLLSMERICVQRLVSNSYPRASQKSVIEVGD